MHARSITVVMALASTLVVATVAARTVRTTHFAITLPASTQTGSIGASLEAAYRQVRAYGLELPSTIPVVVHATTGQFAAVSGAGRMHLAAVRGTTLHLQPLAVLRRHESPDRALAHELVHVGLAGDGGRTPRWLAEGLAMNVAGELHPVSGSYASTAELDRALAATTTHAKVRRAYGSAERLVRALIEQLGRSKVLAAVSAIIASSDARTAFRNVAAIDLDAWTKEQLKRSKAAQNQRPR
jgi:hypothetical protein